MAVVRPSAASVNSPLMKFRMTRDMNDDDTAHATATQQQRSGHNERVTPSDVDTLTTLERIIRSRRTNLRIQRDQPIADETLERLIALATWAPNHHLTEPWRFAVITNGARSTIGQLTAEFMAASGVPDEAKLDKARGKYERAPVVLMVASASATNARTATRTEDRDAVASAIQNVLLGATALGLASYWGTGAVCDAPAVKAFCGFDPDSTVLAAIYLGWPIGDVPVPNRRPAEISWKS
jgi:nitroreductase